MTKGFRSKIKEEQISPAPGHKVRLNDKKKRNKSPKKHRHRHRESEREKSSSNIANGLLPAVVKIQPSQPSVYISEQILALLA